MFGTLPRRSQSGATVAGRTVAGTIVALIGRVLIGVAAAGLAVSLGGGAALARDCTMLLPRADGVLRLDTGDAVAVPCSGPRRAYAALPPRLSSPRTPPAVAVPSQDLDAVTADSLHRLQDETTRLNSELSRLNDETTRLRGETARLSEELARREPAPTATVAPTPNLPPNPPAASKAAPAAEDDSAAAGREFERRKSVVERAWNQLVDMAARMKRDLGAR
ncbi:hypothetical protein [Bradyrhizobium sp. WD16]|uniref:hypothetical protein n=1 Tax=Bradyrhizobium sp. WD16 TaxID=1521768 RepID=UPI0020A3F2E1|nr:hypothetical protein [Bradyrhizobium sp. WD16]